MHEDNPTPDQRAELVIRRLEQFIRDGRTAFGGMPFRKWQDMARSEIVDAILESERDWNDDHRFAHKVLVFAAAGAVTVGFWGTVMAFTRDPAKLDHGLLLAAGGLMLFGAAGMVGLRKAFKRWKANVRETRMARIVTLDRKLKRLDKDLERRVKDLEASLEEILDMKARKKLSSFSQD